MILGGHDIVKSQYGRPCLGLYLKLKSFEQNKIYFKLFIHISTFKKKEYQHITLLLQTNYDFLQSKTNLNLE